MKTLTGQSTELTVGATVVGSESNAVPFFDNDALSNDADFSYEPSTDILTVKTITASIGTASTPAYSFVGDLNTGIYSAGADEIDMAVAGTQKIRIDASGVALFGATAGLLIYQYSDNTANAAISIVNTHATADASTIGMAIGLTGATNMTGAHYIVFRDSDTNPTGSIAAASASTVAYNTSSDRRLKTNITEEYDALSILEGMRPCAYEYIKTPGQVHHGLIAQELYEVFPEAVTRGTETSNPWMIDYGKLTGVLCKAVKELHQKIEILEQKLSELNQRD